MLNLFRAGDILLYEGDDRLPSRTITVAKVRPNRYLGHIMMIEFHDYVFGQDLPVVRNAKRFDFVTVELL